MVRLESAAELTPNADPVFGVLDGYAHVKSRKEQAALRRMLIGDRKQGDSALCRRVFPVEFLVAGHIKRRLSARTKNAET